MKYILHDMTPGSGDWVLAARAVASVHEKDGEVGAFALIEFENGKMFAVRRNKASLSVWPQQ